MIDWGDVPTWIAGVVAAGTPVAAYVAYRRNQRRARTEQARNVHIACFPTGETTRLSPREYNLQPFQVKVWNASTAPITDVEIAFSSPHGAPHIKDAYQADGLPRRRFVEPGESVELEITMMMDTLHYTLEDLYARVSFTDAGGRRWTRFRNGRLFPQGERIPYTMYKIWIAPRPSRGAVAWIKLRSIFPARRT